MTLDLDAMAKKIWLRDQDADSPTSYWSPEDALSVLNHLTALGYSIAPPDHVVVPREPTEAEVRV